MPKVALGFLAVFATVCVLRLAIVTVSTSLLFAFTRRRHASGNSLAMTSSITTVVPIAPSDVRAKNQIIRLFGIPDNERTNHSSILLVRKKRLRFLKVDADGIRCSGPVRRPPGYRCLELRLRPEESPQRRPLCSGDTAKTFEHFIRGDHLSSVGLGDRFQEVCLKFGWNLEGLVRFARKDSDDGTLGQGITLHDDLSTYDGSCS
jgi:hypothetical protein